MLLDKLLNQKEVAERVGLNRAVIAACTKSGKLQSITIPGYKKPRYTDEQVDDFVRGFEDAGR